MIHASPARTRDCNSSSNVRTQIHPQDSLPRASHTKDYRTRHSPAPLLPNRQRPKHISRLHLRTILHTRLLLSPNIPDTMSRTNN